MTIRTAQFRGRALVYPPRASLVSAALISAVVFSQAAYAQSTSSFGSRSMGSSFTPAASNFSGSAAARSAAGGFGGTGGGGAGQGGLGTIAGATQRQDNAGQITGNERFVRQARQPGQFVGSDSRDGGAANFLSQLATASVMNAGRPITNPNANVNQAASSSANSRYIVRVKTDFSSIAPITSPSRISAGLSDRLTRSQRIGHQGPIQVRLEGATAVLTGYVTTVHDRDLAARVALLEPGVAGVRNELLVTNPPPPEAVPPQLPAIPQSPAGQKLPAGSVPPTDVQY